MGRITDQFLSDLLRGHREEIVYLGNAYDMKSVKLPLTLRHFGPTSEGGAGEAYHAGIFGMTGSGKSVLAAYMLTAYARHPELGILIMDPQGQFASEAGLPFSLQNQARSFGRDVRTLSVSQDIRLRKNAPLLVELLEQTRFFKDLLAIKTAQNRESAATEFTRMLQDQRDWTDEAAEAVLRNVLTSLADDSAAIQHIYSQQSRRDQLVSEINQLLNSPIIFQMALELFEPLHSLFSASNLAGERRSDMGRVLSGLLDPEQRPRPLVIIDLSSHMAGATSDSDSAAAILESTPIKARLLREICSVVNRVAEQGFTENRGLNTMVVFDEAQRFAAQDPEDDESRALADRLVDYVRTTRKYGLGWMFITQEIASLRRGLYGQLRLRCFGFGLTSGTEGQRLHETIGDADALGLYRSFVDPQAIRPSQYPFMLTGPISPLSFTGAPVFLSVYTDFEAFQRDNGFVS